MTKFVPPWLEHLGVGTDPAINDPQERAQEAAKLQAEAAKAANQEYLKYANRALALQQQALQQQNNSQLAALMTRLGLAGVSDLYARQLLNAAQAQQFPYQTARLSALQALPVLQTMAGLPAYRVPSGVTTVDFTSNLPNFSGLYNATARTLNNGTLNPAQIADSNGVRANVLSPPQSPSQSPSQSPPQSPPQPINLRVGNFDNAGNFTDPLGGRANPQDPALLFNPLTSIIGGNQTTPDFRYDAQNLQRIQAAGYVPVPEASIPISLPGGSAFGAQPTVVGYRARFYNPNDPTATPVTIITRQDPATLTSSYNLRSTGGGFAAVPNQVGGNSSSNQGLYPTSNNSTVSNTNALATNPPISPPTLGVSELSNAGLFNISGGNVQTNTNPLEAITPAYNFQTSPLYKFRIAEAQKNIDRQLRARGLYGGETGALITSKRLDRTAAEEADKQYNRVRDLVTLGLGGQVTAGQLPTQARTSASRDFLSLGNDLSGILNNAANARSGLYAGQQRLLERIGNEAARDIAQIGTANAVQTANAYTPVQQGNIFNTIAKGLSLYSGLGGGAGLFGGFGSGSNGLPTPPASTSFPLFDAGGGAITAPPNLFY